MDMINIGYSGANTAQVELNVTAQNTANAMTDGYTRQEAVISSIGASSGSPNSAGNGVQVDSIRRVSNQYQVSQVWYAASDYGYYSTQQEYLTQLETVLSDDNTSLSGGFDDFFAALNAATSSPDDSALRQQVISESSALALRVDNTLDYIDSQSNEIASQEQAMVAQVNTLTTGIASYNQQIAQAEANGDNASSLYDARDQMVEELSSIMDVQVSTDDQGNYDVTLQNGQPLVSGQQSSTIALETNTDGTQSMSLTFAGTTSTMSTDTGGSMGALFDYQNAILTPLSDTINSMASQFADAVTAMDDVSKIQSKLGASINRLNDTASNLTSMQDNTEVAIGNIMDTDYATEASNMTKQQVLSQTGITMLKQANSMSSMVSSLLQ
ncbi:flagellar hook-associated protein FlgK [Salmonella enterica subsp. enterica serovar Goldcoast]|nr:flagellar hook-associated protein FlgK [Salmonella enterica subsp. enterica serovar Goldcoast]